MNGKLKAVIYARFSCSKQREESISLDEIESSTSFSSSSPKQKGVQKHSFLFCRCVRIGEPITALARDWVRKFG